MQKKCCRIVNPDIRSSRISNPTERGPTARAYYSYSSLIYFFFICAQALRGVFQFLSISFARRCFSVISTAVQTALDSIFAIYLHLPCKLLVNKALQYEGDLHSPTSAYTAYTLPLVASLRTVSSVIISHICPPINVKKSVS